MASSIESSGTETREQHYVAPNGKEYQLQGNVYVSSDIERDQLDGFRLNPIVKPIQGLGRITLEEVRFSNENFTAADMRIHRLYGIQLDGFKQAVELTDPIWGKPKFVVQSYAGLSEHIRSHVRRSFHDAITDYHPEARIISTETDGVGGVGDHYAVKDKSERDKHGHVGMAVARLALAKALGGNLPQVTVGTSQGTVIAHRMAMENTFGKPANGKINLIGQAWVSPALVDPSHSREVMGDVFLAKFLLNVGAEIALRSSKKEIMEAVKAVGALKIARKDLQAVRYQISQLRKGTPEEDILKVVRAIPTVVIEGTKDAVGEMEMYDRIEADPTSRMHVVRIKGRGHELAMKPPRLMDKLNRTPEYQQFFSEAVKKSKKRAA
jgi:hypothetical protein